MITHCHPVKFAIADVTVFPLASVTRQAWFLMPLSSEILNEVVTDVGVRETMVGGFATVGASVTFWITSVPRSSTDHFFIVSLII